MFNPVFLQASDDTYGSFVNLCKIKFHTVRVSLWNIKWFVSGERDFHCTVHVLDLRFFKNTADSYSFSPTEFTYDCLHAFGCVFKNEYS